MRTRLIRCLPVAAAAAVAAVATALPAVAVPPPGTWAPPAPAPPGPARLYGVTALSATAVWAVGAAQNDTVPVILRWDGSAWTPGTLPAGTAPAFVDVDASGPDAVWAIAQGTGEHLLRWNGRRWKAQPLPLDLPTDVSLERKGQPWVAGADATGSAVLQRKAGAWVRHEPLPGGSVTHVEPITAKDVWAGGGGLAHYDGATWTPVALPSPWSVNVIDLVAIAADDVWAAVLPNDPLFSGPTLFHYDGTAWTERKPPSPFPASSAKTVSVQSVQDIGFLGNIAPDGAGGIWWQPNRSLIYQHFDGTTWTNVPRTGLSGFPYVYDLAQEGTSTRVWGVGYTGTTPVAERFS